MRATRIAAITGWTCTDDGGRVVTCAVIPARDRHLQVTFEENRDMRVSYEARNVRARTAQLGGELSETRSPNANEPTRREYAALDQRAEVALLPGQRVLAVRVTMRRNVLLAFCGRNFHHLFEDHVFV